MTLGQVRPLEGLVESSSDQIDVPQFSSGSRTTIPEWPWLARAFVFSNRRAKPLRETDRPIIIEGYRLDKFF